MAVSWVSWVRKEVLDWEGGVWRVERVDSFREVEREVRRGVRE